MRWRLLRVVVGLAVVTAGMLATTTGVVAAAPYCDLGPASFSMGPQGDSASNRPPAFKVDLEADTTTSATCGSNIIGLDVWEHAYFQFPMDGGAIRGKVMGFMVWNGETVNWGGQIRGTATCDTDCDLHFVIRASAANGLAIMLEQSGFFDLGAEMLVSMDLLDGRISR